LSQPSKKKDEVMIQKSPEGWYPLHLVFRSGDQYVFTIGESTQTIAVRLSSAAIGLFQSHGLGADDVARLAARWGLGRGVITVDLNVKNEDFTALYLELYPFLVKELEQAA
jgi:hypothetical protein